MIVGDERLKSIDEELYQKIKQLIIEEHHQIDDDVDVIIEYMMWISEMKFLKMIYRLV